MSTGFDRHLLGESASKCAGFFFIRFRPERERFPQGLRPADCI